ncbi:hypothetical protein OTU49_015318, partial [Cherax quadricarinatus]
VDTRLVMEMLRPWKILLYVLQMLFSITSIRLVIPQNVPCLVYPPGHACATLPTRVSLRPTSITWVANLYVKNNSKIFNSLRLVHQQGQIYVKLYLEHCGTDIVTTSSWPKSLFTTGSWTNLEVGIKKDKVEFSISEHSSTSIFSTIDSTSADFFICHEHQEAVLAAYDCYSGCYIYSSPKSPITTKLISLVISSTFFLHTLPDFKSLQFTATFRNSFGGFPRPVRKTMKRILGNFTWNKVEVVIHKDIYRVYVNTHSVLASENYAINPLAEVSVFVEGGAFYSIECEPQVSLKQLYSDSTEITQFTELNITSTAMTLPVTTVSVSPATNDTLTTLGTIKSFKFVLHIVFVWTVIIIAGSLINLKFIFHVQQVRAS